MILASEIMLLGIFGMATQCFLKTDKKQTDTQKKLNGISVRHSSAFCEINANWTLVESKPCFVPPLDYSNALKFERLSASKSDCFFLEFLSKNARSKCQNLKQKI